MSLPKYNDEVGGYVIAGKKDPANVTHDGRKGGLFHGKTHQDEGGGIKAVVDNAKPILVETGEVIINKNSSKKYWKLLSKINQAGGGVPIAPPDGASADTDEDPDETFKTGGKVSNVDFNANKLPKASVIKLAKEVRANHPDLWNKYAKVYGNAAFNNLLMAFERGYWEDNEQWMYNKWINYTSAHSNAKTIADVIGLLKWGGVADGGVPFMRKVILDELAKEGSPKPASKQKNSKKQVSKHDKSKPYTNDIKVKDSYAPKLHIVKSFKTDEGNFDIYDIEKDGARGRADMFTVLKDKNGWIIRNAFVPESMQKQGIATDFYKRINEQSLKATGKPLRSTQPRTLHTGEVVHELSQSGIKLWDSLVRKGLAEKLGEKDYRFISNQAATETKAEGGEVMYGGLKNGNIWEMTPSMYTGVEKPHGGIDSSVSSTQLGMMNESAKRTYLNKRLEEKKKNRLQYQLAEKKWIKDLISAYNRKEFTLKDIVGNYDNDALPVILDMINNVTEGSISPFKLRVDYEKNGNLLNDVENKYWESISGTETKAEGGKITGSGFTVLGMVKNVFTNTLKNESDFVKYLPETGDSFYFYKHKDGYFIFRLGEGIYDPDKICIGKDVTWYDISKDELSINSLAKINIYGFASVNLFKSVEDFQGAVSTYEYYLNGFSQKEPYQLTFYYNYYPEKDGSNFDVEGFAENTLSIALRDIDYALEAEYFDSNYIPVTNEETVYLKNISEYAPEYAKGGNANQLNAGIKEEKEHIETLKDVYEHKITPKEGVKEIALKHLGQDPEYYNKLQDHLDKSTVVYANGGVVEQVFSFTTPTGKPSKLTYLQQVLVRTAAFKKFFGDWESAAMSYIHDGLGNYDAHFKNVSKAIDRDTLEPQVQYHGTAAKEEFFQFDVTMQKGYGRPYAYFAVNRQYSENFTNFSQGSHSNAQQVLFSVFVRAMNPFKALGHDFVDKMENASYWLEVIKSVMAWDKYRTIDKRNADVKKLSKVIDDQIKRYFDNFDSQEKFPFWLLMARDNGADFKSFLVSHGYDSVFYAENFTTIYDVNDPSQFTYATTIFAPNQVKLADGRNLDFDLFSPDVRMEEGGNLKSDTKEPEKEFDYVTGRYAEGGSVIDSPASIEIMDNEVNDNKNKLFADFMASVIK